MAIKAQAPPDPPRRVKHTRETAYILRDIDRDLWARVTVRATSEGRTLRGLILWLLQAYVRGKIQVVE